MFRKILARVLQYLAVWAEPNMENPTDKGVTPSLAGGTDYEDQAIKDKRLRKRRDKPLKEIKKLMTY